MKRQQSGFTLIELIMVIVILGILSAFAIPKFADLSGDAEAAALNGALASVKSASAIAHAAFLVSNTSPVTLEDQSVDITNGYPDADDICAAAGLDGFTCATAGAVTTVSNGSGADGELCFTYTEAGTVPTYGPASIPGTMTSGTCG